MHAYVSQDKFSVYLDSLKSAFIFNELVDINLDNYPQVDQLDVESISDFIEHFNLVTLSLED